MGFDISFASVAGSKLQRKAHVHHELERHCSYQNEGPSVGPRPSGVYFVVMFSIM